MEQITTLFIIQALVYLFTSDKDIPETIRYHILQLVQRTRKITLFNSYKKEFVADGEVVEEKWIKHKVTTHEFIETLISCGYCLTFWITLITLLITGYWLYAFLLAIANAFCYKILNF